MTATADERGFVEAGGARLEYRRIAPAAPDRPTLVFLHEGLGCTAIWRDFPDRVAAATGCGALIYSRKGYGGSSPVALPRPLRYMHEEALETLPQVLANFGLHDVVLVGHSDGGSIALIHAGGGACEQVRGLVAMAPHVFNEEICVAGIRRTTEMYRQGDLRARLARLHGDNVDGAFRGWSDTWLSEPFFHWNIQEYLPEIRVPALVIQGRGDEYGSARQYETIAAESGGPVETLVLDDCGHSPHRDRPDEVIGAIRRFILNSSR
jgi:pimeloyl-ACP methyl ester carboxylesterase